MAEVTQRLDEMLLPVKPFAVYVNEYIEVNYIY
jgi:hypothetical protein